ncbi:MAG: hypothetical protein J7M24_06650, partial [Candidatus Latescibacteria bacterium]|nr:hypothetical protein [Candidatus Latescibacterota bacterium]
MKGPLLVVLLLLFPFTAAFSAGTTPDSERLLPYVTIPADIEPDSDVMRAVPTGGAMRVLFAGAHETTGALAVDIVSRLTCEYESVLFRSRTSSGASDENGGGDNVFSDSFCMERLHHLLASDWDAVVLDFDIASLPPVTRDLLARRIGEGTGLLYFGDEKDLKPLSPRGKIDDRQLDSVVFGPIRARSAGKIGDGAVVVMPPMYKDIDLLGYGDFCLCARNALIVASGRRSGLIARGIRMPDTIEYEAMDFMNYRLYLESENESKPLDITIRFRNEGGEYVLESTERYRIEKGKSFISLRFSLLQVGDYSIEIEITDGGEFYTCTGRSFTVKAEQCIDRLDLWAAQSREGSVVAGLIRFSAELEEGMYFKAELNVSFGRRLAVMEPEVIAKRPTASFSFLVKGSIGTGADVRVRYYKNNEHIQTAVAPVFLMRDFDRRKFSCCAGPGDAASVFYRRRCRELMRLGVTDILVDVSPAADPVDVAERLSGASRWHTAAIPVVSYPCRGLDTGNAPDGLPGDLAETIITIRPPVLGIAGPEGCPGASTAGGLPQAGYLEAIARTIAETDSSALLALPGWPGESLTGGNPTPCVPEPVRTVTAGQAAEGGFW